MTSIYLYSCLKDCLNLGKSLSSRTYIQLIEKIPCFFKHENFAGPNFHVPRCDFVKISKCEANCAVSADWAPDGPSLGGIMWYPWWLGPTWNLQVVGPKNHVINGVK